MKNVVLECSKEEYLQSRTEKRRSDYLAESKKGWTIISLFCAGRQRVYRRGSHSDPDADVEENILHTLAVQRVREVVDALPEEDAALLRALYLQTPPLTPVCLQRENRNPGDDAALQKKKSCFGF